METTNILKKTADLSEVNKFIFEGQNLSRISPVFAVEDGCIGLLSGVNLFDSKLTLELVMDNNATGPLVFGGKEFVLDENNTILEIPWPGRYRLRSTVASTLHVVKFRSIKK